MTANQHIPQDNYFASTCYFPDRARTQWFGSTVDPVHAGEYENRSPGGRVTGRHYWNGGCWMVGLAGVISGSPGYAWRGLAEPTESEPF